MVLSFEIISYKCNFHQCNQSRASNQLYRYNINGRKKPVRFIELFIDIPSAQKEHNQNKPLWFLCKQRIYNCSVLSIDSIFTSTFETSKPSHQFINLYGFFIQIHFI